MFIHPSLTPALGLSSLAETPRISPEVGFKVFPERCVELAFLAVGTAQAKARRQKELVFSEAEPRFGWEQEKPPRSGYRGARRVFSQSS